MKAIVYREYGGPEVLRLEDVPEEAPKKGQVLVRVRAAAVNPLDWHFMRGLPYLLRLFARPSERRAIRLGADVAGTVEAVGGNVTRLRVGDDVFGTCRGSFAELVCGSEKWVGSKPRNVSFEEAAAAPAAGVTALQALTRKKPVRPGEKVLVNGASGGVGTFAVQIAKSLGAEVTGVCSARNVELVRSIGADHVIDYTREDFTKRAERYDFFLDNVGNHSLADSRRVLKSSGQYVQIGGPVPRWTAGLGGVLQMMVLSVFVKPKTRAHLAVPNADDLVTMAGLLESGKVKPVIDRIHPLSEVPEAIRYLEEGHARGKVVIRVA